MIIHLQKKHVEKILETMNKFPNGSNGDGVYKLDYEHHGIGSSLDMIIPMSIKGQTGEFTVEIFGSDDW